jgi:hypothetical protein
VQTWSQFAEEQTQMAESARALLYQFGVGLAFLATVRAEGGPRLHPMCPLLSEEGAFAFIVPSPKQRDLRRDGRYALHSFPRPDDENAFYCSGEVRLVDDVLERERLRDLFVEERSALAVPRPSDDDALFEFLLESVLLTRTTGHGDPHPVHRVWRDS